MAAKAYPGGPPKMANFARFWHPYPTWPPRGAKMPGSLGKPSCIAALERLYSKGTGLVASLLPSYGPTEESVSDFCSQSQDGLKHPIFSPQTPIGEWLGHISGSEESRHLLSNGLWGSTFLWPWSPLVPRNSPVAGWHAPPLAGI